MTTEESGDDGWRTRLTRLLDEAVATHGIDAVQDALGRELERIAPVTPAPLLVDRPVLGVDGCPGGWVGVLLRPDGPPTVHAGATVTALVEQVREAGDLAVVAIDIPIGLPDRNGRAADVLARRALPGKASSVFPTATRSAYLASSYDDARARNVTATDRGTSLTRQAWALGPKILEVDAWVRSRPTVGVIEVHPELSFARMAGRPVLLRKRSPEGAAERRRLLHGVGIAVPPWYPGLFGEDDLLDACAAAWSAARHLTGEAESLPEEPEVFSDGIPAAIWV